jgi:NADH-quinone oxidoreductase subunit E
VSTLFDEIQVMRATYPESRSAVMPALQLAQERHGGWLPEQAFREVADALDLTPAYCLSIASFYDMFRLEPIGERVVEVCTNISCGLNGAQQVVEAFESELGLRAGETNDEFTLRTVECLGGCGWATIVAIDNRHRLHVQAGDVRGIVAELRGIVLEDEAVAEEGSDGSFDA